MEGRKSIIKKSQAGFVEWFFVIIVLLGITLFILILNKTWGEIKTPLNEGLSSAMPSDSSVNVTEILDDTSSTTRTFDKLLPFLIIGLFGFVMISAGAIIKHPIMIFVGIIILGAVITLAVVYANVYNSISSSSEFASSNSELPIQNKFMQYLPFIAFFAGIAIVVAVIISKSGGGNY